MAPVEVQPRSNNESVKKTMDFSAKAPSQNEKKEFIFASMPTGKNE